MDLCLFLCKSERSVFDRNGTWFDDYTVCADSLTADSDFFIIYNKETVPDKI